MKRRPILDETGHVRAWLTSGRGVVAWASLDVGAGRPDIFTPADHADGCATCTRLAARNGDTAPSCRKPHWAYMPTHVITLEADALFFLPGSVVQSWRDTPAGRKAAQRALESAAYADETRAAPIGTVHTRYTLHRYAMVSAQISPEHPLGRPDTYGAPLARPGADGPLRLTDVEFRVGIRTWSVVERDAGGDDQSA